MIVSLLRDIAWSIFIYFFLKKKREKNFIDERMREREITIIRGRKNPSRKETKAYKNEDQSLTRTEKRSLNSLLE